MSYYYYGVVLFYDSFRWSGMCLAQYQYTGVIHKTTDAYGAGTAMGVPLAKIRGPLGN